jgi:hypothetical protein
MGDVLDLGHLVVVRQDDGVSLLGEPQYLLLPVVGQDLDVDGGVCHMSIVDAEVTDPICRAGAPPESYGVRMETIIDRVVAAAGRYEGTGQDLASGPFAGTLDIRPLLEGMGAELSYTATSGDGTVLHREHTVLAFDMWSGEATLYVLCPRLNGLGRLLQISATTFDNGVGIEGFQHRIELLIDGDDLTYAWSWSAPGDELAEQLRASLTRST